jgi:3'(2'), 5'-bisphosphate nucleotidase
MGFTDETLAGDLARAAGRLLLTLRDGGLLGGRTLGDVGDAVSQRMLAAALAGHRPDDAVLSEEARDDPARLHHERVWIIDPLDGTREYGEEREDWAVHVALTLAGAPGPSAVAIPARNQLFVGTPGAPSAAGPAADRPEHPIRIAVSRSRPPVQAERLATSLGAELVPIGSAGVKTMAVLTGEVDAYVHAGGQYEWDSAAPVGVAVAAGLHASRIDGSPLRYNRRDPTLPDLLVCRAELAEPLLTALAVPA